MLLVPVVDLMQGQVVRGVRGDRSGYRPIESVLCPGSDPVTVARALCRHTGSPRLYVADLDALQGGAAQTTLLQALLDALPGVEFWLDAGFARAAAAPCLPRVLPVLGSESLQSLDGLDAEAHLLSLDRRDGQRLDAAGCWDSPARWPRRLIVMTLERVGAGVGPDLNTLREVQARAPAQTLLIGAGGIRNDADLTRAADAGAHAWLVASALHDGRIGRSMPHAAS
jgi:HisA/HisF family protein